MTSPEVAPRRVFLIMKVLAVALVALFFFILHNWNQPETPEMTTSFVVPNWTAQTQLKSTSELRWKNHLGQSLTSEDLRGRWTLLDFWAYWCAPCLTELPLLQRAADQQALLSDLNVILVNVDTDKSTEQKQAIQFLAEQEITFTNLIDGEKKLPEYFEIKEYPYHLLINPKGEVVYAGSGAIDWKNPEVTTGLARLLQNGAEESFEPVTNEE